MHCAAETGKISRAERRRREEVARIKGKLILAGMTLTQVDKRYSLPTGTAGNAIHEPNVAGERAIAAALGTRPHLLWPSRYFADGRRKMPQPAENYRYGRRASEAA